MRDLEQITRTFQEISGRRFRIPEHMQLILGWESPEVRIFSLVYGKTSLGEDKMHAHVMPAVLVGELIPPLPLVWLEELEEISNNDSGKFSEE